MQLEAVIFFLNRYGYLINNTTNFLMMFLEDDINYMFRPNPAIIRFSSERVLGRSEIAYEFWECTLHPLHEEFE